MKYLFFIAGLFLSASKMQAQNVGIGTANPAFKLDVKNGSINTDSVYRIGSITVLTVPGTGNLFIGKEAGVINTGFHNTYSGELAGSGNTTGSSNSFFGQTAGVANTSGDHNSFFGRTTGLSNTTGSFNSFFGRSTAYANTTGNYNTAMGNSSLTNITTGSLNTALGYNANVNTDIQTNATALGANARVDCDNCLVLGSVNGVNGAISGVNVGIGINAPTATLDVLRGTAGGGTVQFRGTTHVSHFNYSTTENTYIRAGKDSGHVILNDIPGGKVGIGTASPGFPLSFPNTVGDKISLWGSGGAHYGFGIQGSLLQIHAAGSNDHIAFGYGSSNEFTETMRIRGDGSIGIGTSTPNASAQVEMNSTTKGFLPPRMTGAQRNAISNPVAGLIVWCTTCTTTGELNVYNGNAWTNMIGNPASELPTVTTTAISGINSTSAISGGNVISGYPAITVRGVCWDIAPNPTVALTTKTNNGSGSGIFGSSITGLTLGTTYYVRAYATNTAGTSYGAEFSFTTVFGIGDSYQGGIVFYILQLGDPGYIAGQTHGLIAAASDQGYDAWGCNGTVIPGADGTALGTGNQNTIDIMAGCATAGIAARLCGNLVLNGYSDWYLPSKDELNKLYINHGVVGGFGFGGYWSSSEFGSASAWGQDFGAFIPGDQSPYGKNSTASVRAVRAF